MIREIEEDVVCTYWLARHGFALDPKTRGIVEADRVTLNVNASGRVSYAASFAYPLEYYNNRRWITEAQHQAGVRFGELWTKGFGASLHAQLRYEVRTGPGDPALRTVWQQRFYAARKAIRGEKEKRTAFKTCCLGIAAGERFGMRRLKHALDDLAKHFG